jgi:uncharacterized protein (DUF305 family)
MLQKNNLRQRFALWGVLALTLAVGTGRAWAAPFDQAFIDAMVPHHQGAMMMANMAVKKAHFREVRNLASGIVKDQQKEIKQLKAWRKAWYGSAETPMMHMNGDKMTMPGSMMGLPMKMEMDMGKLKNAKGREFDKMFLQMMIPHHASAISMAQEALDVTGRKELRGMARQIIHAQAHEIGTMQNILDRRF